MWEVLKKIVMSGCCGKIKATYFTKSLDVDEKIPVFCTL
jgi:hypothetical protein